MPVWTDFTANTCQEKNPSKKLKEKQVGKTEKDKDKKGKDKNPHEQIPLHYVPESPILFPCVCFHSCDKFKFSVLNPIMPAGQKPKPIRREGWQKNEEKKRTVCCGDKGGLKKHRHANQLTLNCNPNPGDPTLRPAISYDEILPHYCLPGLKPRGTLKLAIGTAQGEKNCAAARHWLASDWTFVFYVPPKQQFCPSVHESPVWLAIVFYNSFFGQGTVQLHFWNSVALA